MTIPRSCVKRLLRKVLDRQQWLESFEESQIFSEDLKFVHELYDLLCKLALIELQLQLVLFDYPEKLLSKWIVVQERFGKTMTSSN